MRAPMNNLVEDKEILASYGAVTEEPESVPWEEVYPDFNGSVALRGARKREGLTQKELAALVGISQTHISEMEHGKRPIARRWPKGLPRFSGPTTGFFCNQDNTAAGHSCTSWYFPQKFPDHRPRLFTESVILNRQPSQSLALLIPFSL